MSDIEESELFSLAFNAGIASITQVMKNYEGRYLHILLSTSHDFALKQLEEKTGIPTEDVALMFEPHIKPMMENIDAAIREVG